MAPSTSRTPAAKGKKKTDSRRNKPKNGKENKAKAAAKKQKIMIKIPSLIDRLALKEKTNVLYTAAAEPTSGPQVPCIPTSNRSALLPPSPLEFYQSESALVDRSPTPSFIISPGATDSLLTPRARRDAWPYMPASSPLRSQGSSLLAFDSAKMLEPEETLIAIAAANGLSVVNHSTASKKAGLSSAAPLEILFKYAKDEKDISSVLELNRVLDRATKPMGSSCPYSPLTLVVVCIGRNSGRAGFSTIKEFVVQAGINMEEQALKRLLCMHPIEVVNKTSYAHLQGDDVEEKMESIAWDRAVFEYNHVAHADMHLRNMFIWLMRQVNKFCQPGLKELEC